MKIKKFDIENDLINLEEFLRNQYLKNKNMTSWLPERLHDLIYRMDTQYTDAGKPKSSEYIFLWVDNNEIVACILPDGDAIYISIKNGYEDLFESIVSYAEENCKPLFEKDADGSIDFLVIANDSLKYRKEFLEMNGYSRQQEEDYDNYVYPKNTDVSIDLPKGYKLVLINSCVKHELVGSPYNDRRQSCENVVNAVKANKPNVETLRDCTWDDLESVKDKVSEVDYRRAKYVLGEVDRVLAVCDALKAGDYETVGEKMYETHEGLSKDYEVSCEELDFLVELARDCGVTGSRIMGGGFGGCTINLVSNELYATFVQECKVQYKKKFGKACKIIDVFIGDGARKLS